MTKVHMFTILSSLQREIHMAELLPPGSGTRPCAFPLPFFGKLFICMILYIVRILVKQKRAAVKSRLWRGEVLERALR